MLPVRSGKTAALVAEEFGLNELRRDRAAVQRQKWSVAAAAQFVHGMRGELLAGSALTDQEHSGGCGRDAAQLVVEHLHAR